VATAPLQKFLNKRQLHLMMYGYVNGVRRNMPTVSVDKAITQFLAFYKFENEDANALRVQYYEMEKLLREHEKSN
jgi:hypothetical protein